MEQGYGYLKGKNAPHLWLFTGFNIAIFLSFAIGTKLDWSSFDHFWQLVSAKDGIVAAFMPLVTIVMNGLLNDLTKARLVFWQWKNPLPGCRAFSKLMNTDPRIDIQALRSNYGQFPQDPKEQNALWYRLYKRYAESITVSEGHKVYLLTRDMTALSALFFLLFTAGVIFSEGSCRTTLLYGAALFVQYLVLSTSARNYGRRFVLNVLTEASLQK